MRQIQEIKYMSAGESKKKQTAKKRKKLKKKINGLTPVFFI